MTDAVQRAVEKKYWRDSAMHALRTKVLSQLRAALRHLSNEEFSSKKIRQDLEKAINETKKQKKSSSKVGSPVAECISDGLKYEFHVAEIGELAFFTVSRMGSHIMVKINSAHPFYRSFDDGEGELDPKLLSLLAAWAHFELDNTNEKHRQRAQEARADWSRVVRRLFTEKKEFRTHGTWK